MPTIYGRSVGRDDGTGSVERLLEVERNGGEVRLFIHPPGGENGQAVVLPRAGLIDAIRGRGGRVIGASPGGRTRKACVTEMFPGRHLTPVVGGGCEESSDLGLARFRVKNPEIILQSPFFGTPKP